MSDQVIVTGTFLIVYAVIIGYGAYLHRRWRRARD